MTTLRSIKMSDKEKLEELVMLITTDFWSCFSKNDKELIDQRLQELNL
mgnify:CR=1 FL=1